MASGIDWFRWHHGSVIDPKFQLVAKRAGARLGDVIAVWSFLLESASASSDRGSVESIDFETLDFMFDMESGASQRIVDAMNQRGLIADGRIASWEKRQPKRERDDDSSAERKRQQREREANKTNVTPCHATSHQKTPREEKSREEESKPKTLEPSALVVSELTPCPHGEIVALYAELLPELPQPRKWEGTRTRHLKARWAWVLADLKAKGKPFDKVAGLDFFRRMFGYISKSDFLMGRSGGFSCSLPWIVADENFSKIIEGNYENREATA